ncbi:MAG: DUF4924 family protein, partial [Paramuribaculum sp.]|nr:DUF4924 family protein [Paramuribaculum sp.]
ILYMWQIEDIIRANQLDIDKIRQNVVDKYQLDNDQKCKIAEWYDSLIDMMRHEGTEKSGHLQINKNMITQLAELHQAMLKNPKFADYTAEFYRTLPYIVELRSKAGENKSGEIETCFNALYGMLMLRLQGREVSTDTLNAVKQITHFLAVLARNFHLDEAGKLFDVCDDSNTDAK